MLHPHPGLNPLGWDSFCLPYGVPVLFFGRPFSSPVPPSPEGGTVGTFPVALGSVVIVRRRGLVGLCPAAVSALLYQPFSETNSWGFAPDHLPAPGLLVEMFLPSGVPGWRPRPSRRLTFPLRALWHSRSGPTLDISVQFFEDCSSYTMIDLRLT